MMNSEDLRSCKVCDHPPVNAASWSALQQVRGQSFRAMSGEHLDDLARKAPTYMSHYGLNPPSHNQGVVFVAVLDPFEHSNAWRIALFFLHPFPQHRDKFR